MVYGPESSFRIINWICLIIGDLPLAGDVMHGYYFYSYPAPPLKAFGSLVFRGRFVKSRTALIRV